MMNDQEKALLKLVQSYPEGIKEYDLLKLLQEQQSDQSESTAEHSHVFDNLALFQQHFLLFHALYKLSEQLQAECSGLLIIEALNIQWVPYKNVSQQQLSLTSDDTLSAYYLDISNLTNTSRQDVDNLLASFWIKMSDNDQRQEALALFELDEGCTFSDIKKRYRTLLALHHPDKGGSVSTTQSLNEAMAVLKRCYA